jgi:RimJ/RimL family protein N-acetyltransferase
VIDRADGLPRAAALDTERLRLTPLVPADADELFPVLDDRRLHVFTGGQPDTIDELQARLDGWKAERSPDRREAWLNWLVRSADDRRVVGTEAARAILGWLVAEGVTNVEAHVHPEHTASAGVARNAGLEATNETAEGEVVWRRSAARTADAG